MSTTTQYPQFHPKADGPTRTMVEYLVDLLRDRDLSASPLIAPHLGLRGETQEQYVDWFQHTIDAKPYAKVSAMIDHVKSLPKRQRSGLSRVDAAVNGTWRVEYIDHPVRTGQMLGQMRDLVTGRRVPAGRYAIPTPDKGWTNDVTFFSLWVGTRGGWNVRMYVSDDMVDLARYTQVKVLNEIAVDPAAASARYGMAIGKCGVCGRQLTNDTSREIGIGPVCREKVGW